MEKTCEICGTIMKLIPAGISKVTGNAYNAFYACPNKCGRKPKPTPKTKDDEIIDALWANRKELEEIKNILKFIAEK